MFKNVPHVKKNVAGMQVKHLLNVNSVENIWSSFFFLTLNNLLRKEETCFSYKIFLLLVLALVYCSFLQVARGNFIGKLLFKYVFANLKVKMERNFHQRFFFKLSKKNHPHGCFHNLATFCRWFSGGNKGRKTRTLE